MDALDYKALKRLQTAGRETWLGLGRLLGLTAPAAAERVRRLETAGVITGYAALLDPAAVGFSLAAFIAVTIDLPKHRDAFLRRIAAIPEVLECHHVSGDDDYLLKLRCRNTDDLERLISSEIKGLQGVRRTRTTIVLKTVKETTILPLTPVPGRSATEA